MRKIVIAIDGYSACGKSTTAKEVAKILNYGYIDSGAMYRAVTMYFLEHHVALTNPKEVDKAFKKAFATEKADIEHLEEMVEEKIEPYLRVQSEHARIAPKIEEYATKFADEKAPE